MTRRFLIFVTLTALVLGTFAVVLSPSAILAATENPTYKVLEPTALDPNNPVTEISTQSLGKYFAYIYNVALGAAVVLAVLMLVIAGVQYTAGGISESAKSDAKDRIQKAIGGLLLALFSYLLLKTINPQLVNTDLTLEANKAVEISPGDALNPNQQCIKDYANTVSGVYPGNKQVESPALKDLTIKIENTFRLGEWKGKPIPNASILGSRFTYEQENPDCNATRGNKVCGITKCAHSKFSKHYADRSFKLYQPYFFGSNAVDYGMGQPGPNGFDNTKLWGDIVIDIARSKTRLASLRAFCEDTNGNEVTCSSGKGDHVHIQVSP